MRLQVSIAVAKEIAAGGSGREAAHKLTTGLEHQQAVLIRANFAMVAGLTESP